MPKETEEMAALRSAMEDVRSLAETSQKDHPKSVAEHPKITPWKPLKNGGWKTTFLLGRSLFRGYVKLREGTPPRN